MEEQDRKECYFLHVCVWVYLDTWHRASRHTCIVFISWYTACKGAAECSNQLHRNGEIGQISPLYYLLFACYIYNTFLLQWVHGRAHGSSLFHLLLPRKNLLDQANSDFHGQTGLLSAVVHSFVQLSSQFCHHQVIQTHMWPKKIHSSYPGVLLTL